jgi:hypothetical protein
LRATELGMTVALQPRMQDREGECVQVTLRRNPRALRNSGAVEHTIQPVHAVGVANNREHATRGGCGARGFGERH